MQNMSMHEASNKKFLENNDAMPISSSADIDKFLNNYMIIDKAHITKETISNSGIVEQNLF